MICQTIFITFLRMTFFSDLCYRDLDHLICKELRRKLASYLHDSVSLLSGVCDEPLQGLAESANRTGSLLACHFMTVFNCLGKKNITGKRNCMEELPVERGIFSSRRPLGLSFLRSLCQMDVVWTAVSQENICGCKLFPTALKISDECLVISSKAKTKTACSTQCSA